MSATGDVDALTGASLTELSGGLAHELANTGNALQLTADLIGLFLAEGDLDKARSALCQMEASCRRVLGLARALRDLATVPDPLRPVTLSVPSLLESAQEALRDEADAAGACLTLTGAEAVDAAAVRLHCDPLSIRYLLRQLVRNAVDAGARRIEVCVPADRSGVAIQVRDDGHGITEPVRKRMFAMFASTRHGQGHAGLGLWYARCLAQAQQLQLDCIAARPGATIFELRGIRGRQPLRA